MQLALATNENGVVMTSSPALTPAATIAQCKPHVPLATAIACRRPVSLATYFSNSITRGPIESVFVIITSTTASISRWVISGWERGIGAGMLVLLLSGYTSGSATSDNACIGIDYRHRRKSDSRMSLVEGKKRGKNTHFWRACRYLGPYRRIVTISAVSAFLMGLIYTGGLGAVLPILRVLVNGDTVQSWTDRQIAESRLGARLYIPERPVDAPLIKDEGRLLVISVKPDGA